MRRRRRLLVGPLVLTTLALTACGVTRRPGPSGPLLFEGARLFVGDGTVIENGDLIVHGARILGVGRRGTLEVPAGTVRIDATGRTIIPALIDAHAHLGYEGYEAWGGDQYSRENLLDHLDRYAYYGFGAVFSAGSDPVEMALDLQREQEAGRLGGARFLFAAGMAPPGQGPNGQFLVQTDRVAERVGAPVVRGAATPEEAREAVREIATLGVPVVKIWVDDRGGSQVKLAPVVYRAIIDEASRRGLRVFVHQGTAADVPDLIEAGAAGFLHGRLGPDLDAAIASALASRRIFVIPNLGLAELRRQRLSEDPFLSGSVSPAVVERLDARPVAPARPPAADEPLREALARLMQAGVPIALGSDAGAVPDHFFGYSGHRELEIFVRLGMTPGEALIAATRTAAESLGLASLGTLEPGKGADFVILEENPLVDIRNTRSIIDVYLRGVRVDREAMRERWTREE